MSGHRISIQPTILYSVRMPSANNVCLRVIHLRYSDTAFFFFRVAYYSWWKRLNSALAVTCEALSVISMAKTTNRSRTQIMAEILSLCRQPQTKTRVMYQTNLSTKMLKEYLTVLQSTGLLEIHHSITKYAATQKGRRFVEKWKELAELISL